MTSIPGRDDVRIMTLQAHILAEQDRHAHAGTISWILSALSISAKTSRTRFDAHGWRTFSAVSVR